MTILSAFSGAQTGQSLLEFAVATPFILLLVAGSVDYGRFMYDGIQLGNAAKAGVQYGSQNPTTAGDTAGMIAAATSDASGIVAPTATATAYPTCSDGSAYASGCTTGHILDYVQVSIQGTFSPLIRLPGLTNSLTINRTAVEQVSP